MAQPSQIVYQYDGNQQDREAEENLDGSIAIPDQGDIIPRRGKRWKVVAVNKQQELSRGAIPAYLVFLSSSIA